jgi:oligosaccharide repeat unit polymerase
MYLYLLEEASSDIFYYVIAVGTLCLLIYLLRKDITSPIDPIVFCLITFSFITSLVIWLYLHAHILIEYTVEYLLCGSMFIVGFCLASPHKKKIGTFHYQIERENEKNSIDSNIDLKQLKIICLSIALLIIITLLLAFVSNALAIFSDSPVFDRVAMSAANRWFTVVFFAYNPMGMALSTIIFINAKKIPEKILYLFIIIIFLVSLASGGSKAAVLPAVIALGCIVSYLKQVRCKIPALVNRMLLSFLLLSIIYFVYITSLPGTGESDSFSKLITRIAGSGDNYIYFFVEDQYKNLVFTYNIISYIGHTFTAPFGIKLIPHNIGTALYGASTGDYSGFGPNPGYVIEGIIFFGIYLAPLYALSIGYLTNYTRNIFANKKGNLNLILFIIFSFNAPTLPIDITLYIFTILSSLMLNMPIYYLAKIITGKSTTFVT